MQETINIIYLLIVILIPIIPAYLLFKKLKSSAEASGPISPIKEFTVKFGGAFAGYFPIFLLLYFKLPHQFTQNDIPTDVWLITGTVTDAATHKKIQNSEALHLTLQPSSTVPNAKVNLWLPTTKRPGTEYVDYSLRIEDTSKIYFSSNLIYLGDLKPTNLGQLRNIALPDSDLMLTKKTTLSDDAMVKPAKEINN